MKRLLSFDGVAAKKRFELIYQGLHLGSASAPQGQRKFAAVRLEAELLRKLKAASAEQTKDGEPVPMLTGDAMRELVGSPMIVLTQPELDHLKTCMEAVPWKAGASEDVVDAVDFVAAAREAADDAPVAAPPPPETAV